MWVHIHVYNEINLNAAFETKKQAMNSTFIAKNTNEKQESYLQNCSGRLCPPAACCLRFCNRQKTLCSKINLHKMKNIKKSRIYIVLVRLHDMYMTCLYRSIL